MCQRYQYYFFLYLQKLVLLSPSAIENARDIAHLLNLQLLQDSRVVSLILELRQASRGKRTTLFSGHGHCLIRLNKDHRNISH